MASNRTPITVDPRIVSPLICAADDPLTRLPSDTLHRVACNLDLLGDFIGNYQADITILESSDHRFGLALQLSGMASLLEAVADALAQEKSAHHPNELIIEFGPEELGELRKVAAMGRRSVDSLVQEVLAGYCATLRAAFGTHPSPKND